MDPLQWMGAAVLVAIGGLLIGHALGYARAKRFDRGLLARAWREGYDAGVSDERIAAEVDWPEYRQPGRQNPYGKEPR